MAREGLPVLVGPSARAGETAVVRSPGVGTVRDPPVVGSRIEPGSRVGTLRILNREVELRMPPGNAGVVVRVALRDAVEAVEYGQELLALGAGEVTGPAEAPAEGATVEAGGLFAVRAPTDGIFYRRANPASPPFVEVGSAVAPGTTLGLVEVMKCFNYITFGGAGCPAAGTVERILAEDSSEVRLGQALFLVRPG